MLGLKLPTDPRWVDIVEMDLEEILTDHAYCEQKAATNAISNIVRFPDYHEMVDGAQIAPVGYFNAMFFADSHKGRLYFKRHG